MSERVVDAERLALSRNPAFQRAIAEGRGSAAAGLIPHEEIERLYPMTPAEQAYADAVADALDRLEEAQGSEVTDDQGRLLRLILTAADVVRGVDTLEQLATDSGMPRKKLRAAAVALEVAGLRGAGSAVKAGRSA